MLPTGEVQVGAVEIEREGVAGAMGAALMVAGVDADVQLVTELCTVIL